LRRSIPIDPSEGEHIPPCDHDKIDGGKKPPAMLGASDLLRGFNREGINERLQT
jgi:hypothetical protein